MVGDPGGRSEERNLLDNDTLRHNVERIKVQLTKLLDFEPGPYQATLVNNADWTHPITMLEFLRDVGKHFTVNQMMAKDSVRSRIESEHGISYTEFSYMLLQANDFRHLYEHHDVELQAGASDQWGNIVAGVELIRRRLSGQAYAITHPLMTKSDGAKFGKSVGGSVWLDPERTSPYQFRQFWVQCDDDMVGTYLKMLSMRPLDEIDDLMTQQAAAPERRLGTTRPRRGDDHARARHRCRGRSARGRGRALRGRSDAPHRRPRWRRSRPKFHASPSRSRSMVSESTKCSCRRASPSRTAKCRDCSPKALCGPEIVCSAPTVCSANQTCSGVNSCCSERASGTSSSENL